MSSMNPNAPCWEPPNYNASGTFYPPPNLGATMLSPAMMPPTNVPPPNMFAPIDRAYPQANPAIFMNAPVSNQAQVVYPNVPQMPIQGQIQFNPPPQNSGWGAHNRQRGQGQKPSHRSRQGQSGRRGNSGTSMENTNGQAGNQSVGFTAEQLIDSAARGMIQKANNNAEYSNTNQGGLRDSGSDNQGGQQDFSRSNQNDYSSSHSGGHRGRARGKNRSYQAFDRNQQREQESTQNDEPGLRKSRSENGIEQQQGEHESYGRGGMNNYSGRGRGRGHRGRNYSDFDRNWRDSRESAPPMEGREYVAENKNDEYYQSEGSRYRGPQQNNQYDRGGKTWQRNQKYQQNYEKRGTKNNQGRRQKDYLMEKNYAKTTDSMQKEYEEVIQVGQALKGGTDNEKGEGATASASSEGTSDRKIKFRDHLSEKNKKEQTEDKKKAVMPYMAKKKTQPVRSYKTKDGDDETQRGVLIEQLSANEYECMVCCDVIHCVASVWSCTNCYNVIHLRCIKMWARSSAAAVEGLVNAWQCPACRHTYHRYPAHYWCFCGKQREPEFNRYETPHTCGEVCRKKRGGDCVHPCNILCHPGPCPPCQATVTKSCNCTRTKQTVMCSQSANLKCKEVCQKMLNCGKHECQEVCHPGSCSPCTDIIVQECYCQQEKREVLCGSAESYVRRFSCNKTCNGTLDCGNHKCQQVCHPGSCENCLLTPSNVTRCPCGKTELQEISDTERKSCLEAIPTCGQKCGKQLKCGDPNKMLHSCQKKCHEGECGPCRGHTPMTCRCFLYSKDIPCKDLALYTDENPFKCDKRCNRKKTCGQHKCSQNCCVETEHHCDQICGRKLTCGLHRCEEPCHRGNCPQCWQVSFDELHCFCGAETIFPPVPCGTKPPECPKPCTREHNCDHTVRHNCHSEANCPPCTQLTEKWCMGHHEMRRNIPCHLTDISCGLACNADLPCGLHKCQNTCHKDACVKEGEVCQQPCNKSREECGHPCGAPCHGDHPCPKIACQAKVVVKCKCGNRSERIVCLQGGEDRSSEYQKMATMMMAMKMADIQAGQNIDITDLTGEPGKRRVTVLECSKECGVLERNRRLALALEIRNPDVQSKLGAPPYTPFLKDFAKQNSAFVSGIEKAYSDLVLSTQKSKRTSRSHAFPSMNSMQRKVCHELAEFYGCETQSYDEEPKKNVVATATKNKCWMPTVTLTALMQRELHPKAPIPIPHRSKESDIRTSVAAANQSTAIIGNAWGRPAGAPQSSSSATPSGPSTGSWATLVKSSPATARPIPAPVASKPSDGFTRLEPSKSDSKADSKAEKVIDYFDMTD